MKNPLRIVLWLAVIAVVVGAIWLLNRDNDSNDVGQNSGAESAEGGTGGTNGDRGRASEAGADDEVSGRAGQERSLEGLPSDEMNRILEEGQQPPELTPEEQHARAVEAARELNNGEPPTSCQTHCDCPQGQTCQQGTDLCLPSPFKTWCCDRDGCPSGQQCVHMDGTYGICEAE